MCNPMFSKIVFKCIRCVLFIIIRMKCTNMCMCLILYPCMKVLECLKCLRLSLQQVYPTHSTKFINEGQEVQVLPFTEGNVMGPHEPQWINSNFLHALNLDSWKGCLLCFPSMHASHLFLYSGIVGKPYSPFFLNKRRML